MTFPVRDFGSGIRVVDCNAAIDGLGVLQVLDFEVERALREGKLIRLLRERDPPGAPISVVYPRIDTFPRACAHS